MFVGPSQDDVVGPLLAVRSEKEEGGIGLLCDLLQFFPGLEGVDVVLACEECGVGASESALGGGRSTRSLKKVVTSWLVLLPRRKRVFLTP